MQTIAVEMAMEYIFAVLILYKSHRNGAFVH